MQTKHSILSNPVTGEVIQVWYTDIHFYCNASSIDQYLHTLPGSIVEIKLLNPSRTTLDWEPFLRGVRLTEIAVINDLDAFEIILEKNFPHAHK